MENLTQTESSPVINVREAINDPQQWRELTQDIQENMWALNIPNRFARDVMVSHYCGFPDKFKFCSMHDPELKETNAIKAIRQFDCKKQSVFLLLGGIGSGKTHACYSYISTNCQAVITDGKMSSARLKYTTAYKITEAIIRRGYQFLDDLRIAHILYIDDLGTETIGYSNNDFNSFFFSLMNDRYEKNLATLISSNHHLRGIKDGYGERFVSRIRETGIIYETPDGDMRQKGESTDV